VVICHGFKGFMEWGFFPPLADLLCERGFVALRFNYSGSGMAPGDDLVTDLDAFRRNTFSLERDETLTVLNHLEDLVPERVDLSRVALFGHSRGGGAVILAAAAESRRERLAGLVTWSALASFQRYAKDEASWRQKGVMSIQNGRTGQALELGVELLDDLKHQAQALDLSLAAPKVRAPWLIVHGADDETVPVSEARDLSRWAGGLHELVEVDGGSHTFGARHPFVGPTRELIQAMNSTQLWLRRHLS